MRRGRIQGQKTWEIYELQFTRFAAKVGKGGKLQIPTPQNLENNQIPRTEEHAGALVIGISLEVGCWLLEFLGYLASVRNGEAGNPSLLNKFTSGLRAQP